MLILDLTLSATKKQAALGKARELGNEYFITYVQVVEYSEGRRGNFLIDRRQSLPYTLNGTLKSIGGR